MTAGRGRFDTTTGLLSHAGANLATLALFLIMVTTTVDVVSRNFFDRSVPGIIESSEVILVAGAFLGLAYGQRTKSHVVTTVLIERVAPGPARVLRIIGLLLLALYIGFASAFSASRAYQSFVGGEVRFGLIEFPQWPARAAIAVGFFLLLLEILRDLSNTARGRASGEA